MNCKYNLILLLSLLYVFLASCTDEPEIILKPNGRVASPDELSAGDATVFMTSIRAYDTPADWVTGAMHDRFLRGDKLYDDPRTSANDPVTGGLGPLYAGFSCGSCHNNAGRTYPSLFSDGGSGKGFSSQLVYITRQNGKFFRQYGRVLHDQSIVGVEAEGKLKFTYEEKEYAFPDGEKYALITPHYSISEWYADSIAPEDLIIDVHIPLRHVGMG
ncbi:MAG: thiol oxidoreductase, partial [Tannerellaceae bacterium]|nr:thiol oxidoreductase [Tannerellaceae bacterium]